MTKRSTNERVDDVFALAGIAGLRDGRRILDQSGGDCGLHSYCAVVLFDDSHVGAILFRNGAQNVGQHDVDVPNDHVALLRAAGGGLFCGDIFC